MRSFAVTAIAGAATAFAFANAVTIRTVLAGMSHISPAPLGAGLAISLAAIVNRGGLNRAAHNAAGLPAEPLTMNRPSAIGFAANKIVRFGGLAGAAVFVRHGATKAYPKGSVIAACLLASLASLAALGVLLATTIALLSFSGSLSGWWLVGAAGFGAYAFVITAAVALVVVRRDLAERLWASLTAATNRLTKRPLEPGTAVNDLADALAAARSNRRWSRRALGHAIGSKALGAAMLLCAAAAVGAPLGLRGAIIIYATALTASMASIVPAGVGVVEASTGALLVSSGASLGIAALAVALFRVFDLWIPVATGAVMAHGSKTRPDPGSLLAAPAVLPAAPTEMVPA